MDTRFLALTLIASLFLPTGSWAWTAGGGSDSSVIAGPKGDRGDAGLAGSKGDKGDRGEQGPAGTLPSGVLSFVVSGSCPIGWTEVTALSGKTLIGTVAASGDVGTTGGSDSITPTVNSLTAAAQTVNSLTAAAQSFTGDVTTVPAETVNSLTAAAQGFTGDSTTVPALAYGTLTVAWPAGVPTIAWPIGVPSYTGALGTLAVTAHTSVSSKQGSSSGNVVTTATHTFTGVPGGTVAWPAGVPTNTWPAGVPSLSGSTATGNLTPLGHNAASAVTGTLNSTTITPLGHNAASAVTGTMNSSAVTGTLNSFDNRSSFTRVIFCSKD